MPDAPEDAITTATKPAPPSNQPRGAPPLGKAAARGFSWLVLQTLGTKTINVGVQIALAWLLAREDFGLIGLAYTVTAFISVLQLAGLREILIHRHARFNRWANPVFWMSACLGVGGMMVTLAAIPLAVFLYHAPELPGLLAVLSLKAPLMALAVVPQAKLSNALRFKALSVIGVAGAACNAVVACLLAWFGWGAYAIAFAVVASMAARLMMLWIASPHKLRWTMQVRRWRFMLGDGAAILVTGVLFVITSFGDYTALGIFHEAAVVGLYYFAFNLSMQTISLFTGNLSNVLFPALAKLQNEPKRQADAFIRASRVLALVAVPACLMQAALADPLIHLIFPARWYASIPVLQILCIGMAFRAVGDPGVQLIQSQGRFRTLLAMVAVFATGYMAAVGVAAGTGGLISVAIAEAAAFAIISPVYIYVGVCRARSGLGAIVGIYGPAVLGSALAIVPVYLLVEWAFQSPGWITQVLSVIVILAVSVPAYILLMKRLASADCAELMHRVAPIFRDIIHRWRGRFELREAT